MRGSKVTEREIGDLTHAEVVVGVDYGYKGIDALQAAVRIKRGEKVRRLSRAERRKQKWKTGTEMAKENQLLDRLYARLAAGAIHE